MAKNQYLPDKVRRPRDELKQAVEQIENVMECFVVGSWRREKATIGDLDIIVPFDLDFGVVGEQFKMFFGYDPIRSGAVKSEGICTYKDAPLLINLWRVPYLSANAAMFLYATGPTDMNIMMRAKAQGKGWKLSQYGLFDGDTQLDVGFDELLPVEDLEAQIFTLLDLEYLDPPGRENWRDVLLSKQPKKKTVTVASSNGVDRYFVTIEEGKAVECECQGYTYRKKCRHLGEAEAILKKQ
jgi:DNA polymerase/3'-5' exonuclease PolX